MPDPYLNVDGLKPETTEAIITRLEERGCHPFFLSAINSYAAVLPRDRVLNILELGCGTGVVLRHVETIVDSSCELIGADISEKLLAAARTHSPENSKIRWDLVAPSAALPYADGYFDVIIMHTLLSHVPEIHAILCEAHRVLSVAGRLIIFDADHASTTYSLPDFATTRETDLKLVSAISTHPAICRQLPAHLKLAGFTLQSHDSRLFSECGKGDFWLSSVRGFARLIPALSILPEQEGKDWEAHMLQSHEDGTFFAAGAFYTFHAIKDTLLA